MCVRIKNFVTESRSRYHKLAYYCRARSGVGTEAREKNKKQLIKTVNGRGTYLFVIVVVYYLHVSLNNLKPNRLNKTDAHDSAVCVYTVFTLCLRVSYGVYTVSRPAMILNACAGTWRVGLIARTTKGGCISFLFLVSPPPFPFPSTSQNPSSPRFTIHSSRVVYFVLLLCSLYIPPPAFSRVSRDVSPERDFSNVRDKDARADNNNNYQKRRFRFYTMRGGVGFGVVEFYF